MTDRTAGLPDDYPTGLFTPGRCPRGLDNCAPLAQIISTGRESFFCCGESDPETRTIPEDRFRLCFKGEFRDTIEDFDERDMKHQMSVMAQALAVDDAGEVDDEQS